MVRLIVDDAGSRRAFNVGEGRLSVGSGDEAKLKLSAHGVASLHVDIEIHGGKATLHPRPGVTAPHVLGRAANGPVVLQHGVPVKIGGASVTVEFEGLPSKLDPKEPKPVVRSGSRASDRDRADRDDDDRPARHVRKQGTPVWIWVAVGLPVVGLVAWFVASKVLTGDSSRFGAASAQAYYLKSLDRYKNAQYEQASNELNLIPADAALDPTLAAQVAKLREDIKQRTTEAIEYSRNEMAGRTYFGTQLEAFVNQRMSGKITPSQARVFMKRARYFREKWPTHPELAWVARQEERFKNAIDLSKPPTFEDVAYEVETLTWSHPRNYKEAFEVARAFQANATGADAGKIAGFLKELEQKRAEWFTDRLEQARWHFDRDEKGKSIGVLLSIVRGAGDDAMADEAAERFMKFGDMESWLRGYRNSDPDGFNEIAKNRLIGAFVREHKL